MKNKIIFTATFFLTGNVLLAMKKYQMKLPEQKTHLKNTRITELKMLKQYQKNAQILSSPAAAIGASQLTSMVTDLISSYFCPVPSSFLNMIKISARSLIPSGVHVLGKFFDHQLTKEIKRQEKQFPELKTVNSKEAIKKLTCEISKLKEVMTNQNKRIKILEEKKNQ